jgi:hypothetical protein
VGFIRPIVANFEQPRQQKALETMSVSNSDPAGKKTSQERMDVTAGQ